MKHSFQETVKKKTDKELEIISKDYVFYSEDERLIALNELISRNKQDEELVKAKKKIEKSKEFDKENSIPVYKISLKDLIPQKNYLFTPLLIYSNCLVFILMVFGANTFNPKIDTLVQWGGNVRILTLNGQIWRLFTSLFLHAGILHLVFNMFTLLYIGSLLEKLINKNKFILAYLISGIVASVTSLIFNDKVVSVGASGAIFGIVGVLLMLLIFNKSMFSNISVQKLIIIVSFFVLYNIFGGFNKQGIDIAAHIGGLFSGIIIGVIYCLIIRKKIIVNK
jgi:rhomboid protease GluP